jgi:hypothetical protein
MAKLGSPPLVVRVVKKMSAVFDEFERFRAVAAIEPLAVIDCVFIPALVVNDPPVDKFPVTVAAPETVNVPVTTELLVNAPLVVNEVFAVNAPAQKMDAALILPLVTNEPAVTTPRVTSFLVLTIQLSLTSVVTFMLLPAINDLSVFPLATSAQPPPLLDSCNLPVLGFTRNALTPDEAGIF